jgi:hypothetical protein
MAARRPQGLALCRDLPAVAIDPLTRTEIGPHRLPVGTVIENALAVLREAEAHGARTVTVRVLLDGAKGVALERVDAAMLRKALELPPSSDGGAPS